MYLSIAGFLIKLKFTPPPCKQPVNNIREKIEKVYKGFIVQNRLGNKCLIEIHFLRTAPYVIQQQKNSPNFTLAFYHIRNSKIITYLHISINHFITLLLRIIQDALLKNNGFFLHCSAVEIDGKVHVFVGRPGAGKSTILNLTRKKINPLADDSGIIIKEKNNFCFYQSPVAEKYNWIKKTGKSYPVDTIYFIRKSKDFRMKEVNDINSVISLITAQTWSLEKDMKTQIKTILKFAQLHPRFYYLYFAKDKKGLITFLTKNSIRSNQNTIQSH